MNNTQSNLYETKEADLARNKMKEYLECMRKNPKDNVDTRSPFSCLSPDHEDIHPSMSFDPKTNKVLCFSCSASYDIFDIVAMDYQLEDKTQIFFKTLEVLEIEKPSCSADINYSNTTFKVAWEEYPKSPGNTYLRSRGITDETAMAYNIGFLPSEDFMGIPAPGVLLIPTSETSYITRSVDPACPVHQRYKVTGKAHFFNNEALYHSSKPVFIAEGAIDALSIIQCKGAAISINSVVSVSSLISEFQKRKPTQPIIIAFDADDKGCHASAKLEKALAELNIPYATVKDWNGCKDANELLQKDPSALEALISNAEKAALQMQAASIANDQNNGLALQSVADRLDTMFSVIDANAAMPTVSTGFPRLDAAMGNRLPTGIVTIGGLPGAGKSAFILHLVSNLAKNGKPVLYFSLEMSEVELLARQLSRHMLEWVAPTNRLDLALSAGDIMMGKQKHCDNPEIAEVFQQALAAYKQYADKIYVIQATKGITADGISKLVQQGFDRKYFDPQNPPVIVVDFLQLISSAKANISDKNRIDDAVSVLNNIAHSYGTTVFCLSSLNRASYSGSSMQSFKESGNIEYQSSSLWLLTWPDAPKPATEENPKPAPKPVPKKKKPQDNYRYMTLDIVKGRYSSITSDIRLYYYPAFNFFMDAEC